MVTPRKRARTVEVSANPNHNHHEINENGQNQETQQKKGGSEYEQCREERIKENLERMQKLGIFDLSLQINIKSTPKTNRSYNRKTPQQFLSPLPASQYPVRRSSRLQNSTPVSYSEVEVGKKDSSLRYNDYVLGEGSRPEIYTEEHEKQLGNTELSWTLFVDGYGKDGKRIYDQVKGKTCHQCRQKTLGHRTHCSQCNLVQGQFCGDCLYMRYGEHVLEANKNPNWICPACRGICNCSLCRQAKGWPPTGSLYRKISQLGYKSVAHYLIQTRSETELGKNSGTMIPHSAKRSLPFSDTENMSQTKEEPSEYNDDQQRTANPKSEVNATDDDFKGVKKEEMNFLDIKNGDVNSVLESNQEEKEEKMQCLDCKDGIYKVAPESTPETKNEPAFAPEPTRASIAGRLRHRRHKGNGHDVMNEDSLDINPSVNNESSKFEAEAKMNSVLTDPSVESIAGMHKCNGDNEEMIGMMNEDNTGINQAANNESSKNEAVAEMGSSSLTSPSVDSIGGRLRVRRNRN